jgi:4-amino-4-deoxy-L-arabinose transferase-like glycosyltransferase
MTPENPSERVPEPIDRKVGWSVFIVACALRLAVGLATGRLLHPEIFEYDGMAKSLLAGKGLSFRHLHIVYHSFAPPLYPWLSAASYWMFGSLTPLMILQVIVGGWLAVLAAAIAKRFSSGWLAPLAAGLLVAFHPGLIVYDIAKAHPLAFDALFFTLAVLQAFRLRERMTMRRAIELGVILGLGSLSRGTLIIFLPLVALWLLWSLRTTQSLKKVIGPIVIAGAITTAIVIPWTIRCSLMHHRFVFMVTTDAESFWRGNNPNATGGTYGAGQATELEELPPGEMADLRAQPDEIAQVDWFSARSHAFIREHPGAFVRLTALKLFHFWWLAPQTGIEYPRSWFIGYLIYYVLIILSAAIGAWTIFRNGKLPREELVLILVFLFALSLLQSLYYVEGRHRWAVEPILIAVSGAGFARFAQRRRASLEGNNIPD